MNTRYGTVNVTVRYGTSIRYYHYYGSDTVPLPDLVPNAVILDSLIVRFYSIFNLSVMLIACTGTGFWYLLYRIIGYFKENDLLFQL